MTKPILELTAWLKEKIGRDTEWLEHIENLGTLETDETVPSYTETKYNIEMMQAILAALEELEKLLIIKEAINMDYSGPFSSQQKRCNQIIDGIVAALEKAKSAGG